MKERSILFSGDMVRAILDGRKTQTRRVVKYDNMLGEPESWCCRVGDGSFILMTGGHELFCPHGKPGDRLWVRETWRAERAYDSFAPREIPSTTPVWYECDGMHGALVSPDGNDYKGKSRPSIFMLRWASRITLEITDVRVERVQDISERDAAAEGVSNVTCDLCGHEFPCGCTMPSPMFVESYKRLWDSINAKRPGCAWADNPWVWVISFRRIDQ